MLWMLWWLFVEEEEDFEEGERDRERERYEEEVRSVAGIVVFLLFFFGWNRVWCVGVYGNGIETGRGISLASVDRFCGLGVWGGLWMDGWMDGCGLFVLCPCDGVKLENLNVEVRRKGGYI